MINARFICALAVITSLAAGLRCDVAQAQLFLPNTNGGENRVVRDQTGVPRQFMNLTDINFTFDRSISPLFTLGVLSADANRIMNAHNLARQQTKLAINYLTVNRSRIISGADPNFNRLFGNFYTDNQFRGQYQATTQNAIVSSEALRGMGDVATMTDPYLITAAANAGGGANAAAQSNNWLVNLRPGDSIRVTDGTGFGQVVGVQAINHTDFDDVEIVLDPARSGAGLPDLMGATIHKVIDFEEGPNLEHFNRVLNTYTAMETLLDTDTSYQGDFQDLAALYPAGTASLGLMLEYGADGSVLVDTDRRLREAGFSNSDSAAHLANLMAILDPTNTTTAPLLWTDDNDGDGDGAADENGAFHRFVQTLFGSPGLPNQQFVGRAFLDEELLFADEFFDVGVASDTPLELDANGNPIPGTGTPTSRPTALRQWQMIMRSFAENSTDLSLGNTAVIGMMELQNALFPGGSPQFLEARDAGRYAEFADLIKSLVDGGTIDPAFIEPVGKRAGTGGFEAETNFAPFVLIP